MYMYVDTYIVPCMCEDYQWTLLTLVSKNSLLAGLSCMPNVNTVNTNCINCNTSALGTRVYRRGEGRERGGKGEGKGRERGEKGEGEGKGSER